MNEYNRTEQCYIFEGGIRNDGCEIPEQQEPHSIDRRTLADSDLEVESVAKSE